MILPPIKKMPADATQADHDEEYWFGVDELVRLNPRSFLPIGVRWRWWHLLKIEHPRTEHPLLGGNITSNLSVCRMCGK